MKKVILLSLLCIAVIFIVSSFKNPGSKIETNTGISIQDSLERDRAKYVALVREAIKGKENLRADSVFKNIKMLQMPASRLLSVMQFGYSRSLGVSCGHCHNTNDFASEEKPEKEITRKMADMVFKINFEMLNKIEGLKSSPAVVNCTTCHRGELKPALNLQ